MTGSALPAPPLMVGNWIVAEPAAGTAIVDEPWALPMAQFAVTLAFSVKVPPPEPRETCMCTTRSFVAPGSSGPMSFQVMDDLVTASAGETEAAGERLGRLLAPGRLLLLTGELGAGKTTFVRGLAAGMGVAGDVMSPTFQLVRVYRGPLQLAHVDLYRLGDGAELADLGLDELLDEGAVVVEWGDRLRQAGAVRIAIEAVDEGRRRLRLEEAPATWSW